MKFFASLIGIFIALCLVGSSYQEVNSTLPLKAQNGTLMGSQKNESLTREPRRHWERRHWERRHWERRHWGK